MTAARLILAAFIVCFPTATSEPPAQFCSPLDVILHRGQRPIFYLRGESREYFNDYKMEVCL